MVQVLPKGCIYPKKGFPVAVGSVSKVPHLAALQVHAGCQERAQFFACTSPWPTWVFSRYDDQLCTKCVIQERSWSFNVLLMNYSWKSCTFISTSICLLEVSEEERSHSRWKGIKLENYPRFVNISVDLLNTSCTPSQGYLTYRCGFKYYLTILKCIKISLLSLFFHGTTI